MVKELSITLDQASSSFVKTQYVPGSAVAGILTIEEDQPKEYRQIAVYLRGDGLATWSRGSGENRVSYYATEKYIEEQVVVWRSENSPDGTFPAGRYTYPFQLTLPANCPSSFKSPAGKIEYLVEAVVSTGQFRFDHKVKRPITVLQKVSAKDPQFQEPVRGEKRKTVGCLCCKAGEITLNAELERSGFNVGEDIPVSFYIENGSGRRVTVRCELVETVHYYAQGRHIQGSKCISHSSSESINSHTTSGQLFARVPLLHDLRPAITGSGIIKSVYTANVKASIPCALSSAVELSVVIGNNASELTVF